MANSVIKHQPILTIRRVNWDYTISNASGTWTNLKTLIDNDLPSGYRCLGIVGYTTSDIRVVPVSVRYYDTQYSLQLIRLNSDTISQQMIVYYLAVKD